MWSSQENAECRKCRSTLHRCEDTASTYVLRPRCRNQGCLQFRRVGNDERMEDLMWKGAGMKEERFVVGHG